MVAHAQGNAYQTVIIRACMICGNETAFAKAVNAPVSDVIEWIIRSRQIPPEYFLRAVDIVLATTQQQVIDTKVFLEQVRSRQVVRRPDACLSWLAGAPPMVSKGVKSVRGSDFDPKWDMTREQRKARSTEGRKLLAYSLRAIQRTESTIASSTVRNRRAGRAGTNPA